MSNAYLDHLRRGEGLYMAHITSHACTTHDPNLSKAKSQSHAVLPPNSPKLIRTSKSDVKPSFKGWLANPVAQLSIW